MEDEQVDVYDENLKPLRSTSRTEAHRAGLLHRTFHCWFADNSALYFQIRGNGVAGFPGMLDVTVGGHIRAGENPEQASREILEEVGMKISFGDLHYLGTNYFSYSNALVNMRELAEVFIFSLETGLEAFSPSPWELSGIAAVPYSTGSDIFKQGGRPKQVQALVVDSGLTHRKSLKISWNSFVPESSEYFRRIFFIAEKYVSGMTEISL